MIALSPMTMPCPICRRIIALPVNATMERGRSEVTIDLDPKQIYAHIGEHTIAEIEAWQDAAPVPL